RDRHDGHRPARRRRIRPGPARAGGRAGRRHRRDHGGHRPRGPPRVSGDPRGVVLVSGDGSNLQAIIDEARRGALGVTLAGVVSDRPGVRALDRARQAGIPATVVDYSAAGSRASFGAELAAALAALRPDIVVLAGFMRILPDALVAAYQGRML